MSRALEIVGERWALLIVRDLLAGPKRFTDLRQGLPRIPTNVLSARLKELEQAKVLQRRILPRPATAVVYELTEYGRELDDILIALGRWGVQSMAAPEPGDIYTASSLMMAMRAGYQTAVTESSTPTPATYELHITDVVLGVTVKDGELDVTDGPPADPDLVIKTEHALAPLLMRRITPAEALESGDIQVVGNPELLTEFAHTFHW